MVVNTRCSNHLSSTKLLKGKNIEVLVKTRACSRCGLDKPLTREHFYASKAGVFFYHCKECHKRINQQYKEYRRERANRLRKESRSFRNSIRKARRKYDRSEKGKTKKKEQHEKHHTKELQYGREYYKSHRQERIDNTKRWRLANPDKVRRNEIKSRKKRNNNPIYRLSDRVRLRLRKTLLAGGWSKDFKTFDRLAYLPFDLYEHLKKFIGHPCVICNLNSVEIMESHIDHITPICIAQTIDDVITLNQLSNLRLICGTCNLKKSAQDREKKNQSIIKVL